MSMAITSAHMDSTLYRLMYTVSRPILTGSLRSCLPLTILAMLQKSVGSVKSFA